MHKFKRTVLCLLMLEKMKSKTLHDFFTRALHD